MIPSHVWLFLEGFLFGVSFMVMASVVVILLLAENMVYEAIKMTIVTARRLLFGKPKPKTIEAER